MVNNAVTVINGTKLINWISQALFKEVACSGCNTEEVGYVYSCQK